MNDKCHKTQDIDLALFLIEPHGSEWQEFRAHYPQCVVCSAELQKWSSLEHRLRSLGNTEVTDHPTPETLVQFQQHSNHLPAEERHTIAAHLSTCVMCREEVKLLGSFDPSHLAQWVTNTKADIFTDVRDSWSTRVWNALRPLFLHPAFAAGLVLLLSVPFIRSYYLPSLNQTPVSSDIAPASAPAPATAMRDTQVSQKPAIGPGEWQTAERPPQVVASAPSPGQESPSVAPAPPIIESTSKTEKAKESTRITPVAKRSAQREDFAGKDERVPAPPSPASPAPLGATAMEARDEATMAQPESRTMVEEKKQRAVLEHQNPAFVEEREARSTEGPVVQQRQREQAASPIVAASRTPAQAAARLQGNMTSQESQIRPALTALLATYKSAYEARDIHTLGTVWRMSSSWQDVLTQLFAKTRQITLTLTLDENNLTESADQRQVFMPITQFVTTVNSDGQTSTNGPFYCLVDLRKQNTGQWKIHDLQDNPQHPGQCQKQ